ncbi:hypothetical protein MNEG_12826 [Monoraphidium neglectum]|uniref:Uncharacterized protein n=1 Tax=Monoraphidium neglectum TaxID=145388 RepID=A0A0D2J5J9_9CHLO|nr:hypothetical protein MNEG_12826 [Monoraphidium neglectum]KIY95137.1 hypothetical protein MNEG_12826 [Monoraphidium neglectum]|eukprot:XP_013894157.1 hypothetical protein MNEG_12826 [Monoraphidium neglectum]
MRRAVVASLCLVFIAGAHAARQQSPAPKGDPRPNAEVPAIPEELATFDVSALAPATPVLPEINITDALRFISLVPLVRPRGLAAPPPLLNGPRQALGSGAPRRINVTWVEQVLPYIVNIDPQLVGRLGAAIIEPIQKIDPAVLGSLIPSLRGLDWKGIAELIPLIGQLDINAIEKLVPAINAFKPEVVAKLIDISTRLTPETYNALTNILNLGIPAINSLTAKLNLLPGLTPLLTAPTPRPYVASASDSSSGFPNIFKVLG